MPARARNLTTIALTCVMAVLLCLAQTASAVAAKSPEKTASGIFFADPNIYAGEIAPESQQSQWEIDPAATPTASGRQVWLSADPIERVTGELAELLPGSSNLYSYVVNDPINRWDPLGLVDSVDTGITSMMFKGDIEGLKMVLQGLEGAQAQTCRMAIEKASQPVVRLIKGSLKRSKSYDTGLENHTIQELAQLAREGSVKAAKMLKLLKNEGRILDKCKG